MRAKLFATPLCLVLASCAAMEQPSATAAPERTNWRIIATDADRARLRDWRSTFVDALEAARRAGHAADIVREGRLLQPDAAIPGALPNGDYRCRVIKVGAKSKGLLNYIAYPAFRCRVAPSGLAQSFTKLTGSQRQVGLVYPVDQMRQVFLGTLVLGDERGALRYGQDEARDVVAFIERIEPGRWRMIMPRPYYESKLDVIELVPAS